MPTSRSTGFRHTFATRLSAGGVADHFVTQLLRQGDSAVFKRYNIPETNCSNPIDDYFLGFCYGA